LIRGKPNFDIFLKNIYFRVRVEKGGGAWCPRPAIQHNVREWLEVALPSGHGPFLVTASETQGRFGNGQGQEFAEAFIIEYWRHHLNRWVIYKNANSHQVNISFFSYFLVLIDDQNV
jgi:discoidin domain receptor family protein 2